MQREQADSIAPKMMPRLEEQRANSLRVRAQQHVVIEQPLLLPPPPLLLPPLLLLPPPLRVPAKTEFEGSARAPLQGV